MHRYKVILMKELKWSRESIVLVSISSRSQTPFFFICIKNALTFADCFKYKALFVSLGHANLKK